MSDEAAPKLQAGMFVWDPVEGGTLYAVARINVRGAKPKAILVQHTGGFATKLGMKHDRLPEGWQIVDQRELIDLINQHPSQVGVEA